MSQEIRAIVKPYGMTVLVTSKHNQIWKDGKKVYTFAGSPKSHHQAVENTIKDLVNCGYLPAGLTYKGKVYKKKLV